MAPTIRKMMPENSIANATWMIFIATAVNVIVAVFQWSAIQNSNQTTREFFTSVQRAFVFGKQLLIRHDTNVMAYWRFGVQITNPGNTPTEAMDYLALNGGHAAA